MCWRPSSFVNALNHKLNTKLLTYLLMYVTILLMFHLTIKEHSHLPTIQSSRKPTIPSSKSATILVPTYKPSNFPTYLTYTFPHTHHPTRPNTYHDPLCYSSSYLSTNRLIFRITYLLTCFLFTFDYQESGKLVLVHNWTIGRLFSNFERVAHRVQT